MSTQIVFHPSSEIQDPAPIPAEILAVSRVAQHARVSMPHAAVVAQLAGLGPREGR